MNQQEINAGEWNNPENWSGLCNEIYFSKKDSRSFVPRPGRWKNLGWSVNLARPLGIAYLYASCLFLLGLGLAIAAVIILVTRG